MKKCILVSRFAAINIGDLTIANILYNKVSEYFNTDKYDYFTGSLKVRDINNVLDDKEKAKSKVRSRLSNATIFKNLKKYIRAKRKLEKSNEQFNNIVGQYDVVIIGGGNMLMSLDPESWHPLRRFERFVDSAKEQKKPVFIMDIGIGPFASKEHAEYSVSILNKCDYITFRDENSYNIYINDGGIKGKAKVSLDPALYLKNIRKSEYKIHNCIGINIINSKRLNYNRQDYKKSINNYGKLIERIISEIKRDVIIFITSREDEEALDDVYKNIRDKKRIIKYDVNGLKDLLEIYHNIDILIGTRMHSMIIAYTQGVPLIALSWQKKIDSFFEIIDETEYLYEFKDFGKDIDKIINSSKGRLDNIKTDKGKINEKLVEIREHGRVDKEILETLA